ncbi:PA14 domain containing protein [uncultured Caudovirales phage]|uniref:PA14 domain containing protein n=1 Tax=uncultured Caudovirales phage TaxID=2100421 RepID=A0A6J5NKY8_9CAUD|nr:PA14 domain containing protein [uncultured Caudovirales phage]
MKGPYLNKLFRMFIAVFLAFGWLFISPTQANSDDPLTIAAMEIQNLNSAVDKLDYKDGLINMIDIAENKFMYAKNLRDVRNTAIKDYEDAVEAEDLALEAKDLAQSNVDGQTVTVELALDHKNDAYDSLEIANINLSNAQQALNSAGVPGLRYDVYSLIRVAGQAATDELLCSGTWNSNSMQLPVCGNRYSNFIVKFTGQITVPSWFTQTKFAGYTDDGFKMYINGQLAINNWREQGTTWSPYSPLYDVTENKVFGVEIWWYNGGGPGSYHLGWAIPGGWTGAGCDYAGDPRVWGQNFSCNLNTFSSGSEPTATQTAEYQAALSAKNTAQQEYNDKLNVYNQEVATLNSYNQDLTNKTSEYDNAVNDTEDALSEKSNAISNFNNAILDVNSAIDDAWRYYDEQSQKEIQRAIAQAAANAAANQPKPEPSPEPKPTVEPEKPKPSAPPTDKPDPKPTNATGTENPDPKPTQPGPKPTPPKEEPKPEEPKPTPATSPEPKPEPSPEPPIAPSPEPKPLQRPDFKPAENIDPVIKNEVLAALIPQKGTGTSEDLSGVIANLTSKDNKLVKLSPEQTAAVSQTLKALTKEAKQEIASDLGISAAEVAKVAEAMKSDPAVASAFVEFAERAGASEDAAMPFTLADATTEVQTEAFLEDPLGAIFEVDVAELLSNFSELGMDMTDDQREKAQEVIIPVVIVSQIASTIIGMRR